MTPEQRAALRQAGRAKAAALPPVSPECAARIAELLRDPINTLIRAELPDGIA
jgi:hypothetical protein